MKKSIFTKIGAAAVALTLVTASLVGGTFAKYTSTAAGTGTATVAAWKIAMQKDGAAFADGTTFNLTDQSNTMITDNDTIAPGSFGEIALKIDGTGSQIGYHYEIAIDPASLGNVPIKFYDKAKDAAGRQELTKTDGKYTYSADVALESVKTAVEKSIYWEWDTTKTDAEDTTLASGNGAVTGTIGISLTATQLTTPAQP